MRNDRGITLIELAVYIVLIGIVAAIVTSVVMITFRAESIVSSATNAASSSQSLARMFDSDVRNSCSASFSSADGSPWVELRVADESDGWVTVLWEIKNEQIVRTEDGGNEAMIVDGGVEAIPGFSMEDRVVMLRATIKSDESEAKMPVVGTTILGPDNQEGC